MINLIDRLVYFLKSEVSDVNSDEFLTLIFVVAHSR